MTRATTLDWSDATVLTAAAFEVCWETLRLGETPWQLEPPRHGRTAQERRAFVTEVQAQMPQAGPELPVWLRLLARPEWSVDVRVLADELVTGVAACAGADGVLAVRCGTEIALLPIRPHLAAAAVLSLLGPIRPGPGRPMLVPTGDDPVPDSVMAAWRDVRMVGQLGASTAVRDGSRMRRAPRVVGFHRTAAGDYRSVRVNHATMAVEPATQARLLTDLDELLV